MRRSQLSFVFSIACGILPQCAYAHSSGEQLVLPFFILLFSHLFPAVALLRSRSWGYAVVYLLALPILWGIGYGIMYGLNIVDISVFGETERPGIGVAIGFVIFVFCPLYISEY